MTDQQQTEKPITVPVLPHNCGSWVVVCLQTGKAVAEIFKQHEGLARCVDADRFKLVTALEWLQQLNTAEATHD